MTPTEPCVELLATTLAFYPSRLTWLELSLQLSGEFAQEADLAVAFCDLESASVLRCDGEFVRPSDALLDFCQATVPA